jgi:hypothetical protein
MVAYGVKEFKIKNIITANVADFERYPFIEKKLNRK